MWTVAELRVVAIDPGPTPGIVVLDFSDPALLEVEVVQCTAGACSLIVEALLRDKPHTRTLLATEKFVIGRKSMRSGAAGATTRDMVGELQRVGLQAEGEVTFVQRSASQVKPWATTGGRLDKAGLIALTKGMVHARSASWHALFAAVHDGGIPDPLSRDWKF
jgi:hypothetical protein